MAAVNGRKFKGKSGITVMQGGFHRMEVRMKRVREKVDDRRRVKLLSGEWLTSYRRWDGRE